jgi:hypothetical protein
LALIALPAFSLDFCHRFNRDRCCPSESFLKEGTDWLSEKVTPRRLTIEHRQVVHESFVRPLKKYLLAVKVSRPNNVCYYITAFFSRIFLSGILQYQEIFATNETTRG